MKKLGIVFALILETGLLVAYYQQAPPAARPAKPAPAPNAAPDSGAGLFPQPPAPPPASGTARTTAPQKK